MRCRTHRAPPVPTSSNRQRLTSSVSIAKGLNADGIPDLISSNRFGSNVAVLAGLGTSAAGAGDFAPPLFLESGDLPQDIIATDLNGDHRVGSNTEDDQ